MARNTAGDSGKEYHGGQLREGARPCNATMSHSMGVASRESVARTCSDTTVPPPVPDPEYAIGARHRNLRGGTGGGILPLESAKNLPAFAATSLLFVRGREFRYLLVSTSWLGRGSAGSPRPSTAPVPSLTTCINTPGVRVEPGPDHRSRPSRGARVPPPGRPCRGRHTAAHARRPTRPPPAHGTDSARHLLPKQEAHPVRITGLTRHKRFHCKTLWMIERRDCRRSRIRPGAYVPQFWDALTGHSSRGVRECFRQAMIGGTMGAASERATRHEATPAGKKTQAGHGLGGRVPPDHPPNTRQRTRGLRARTSIPCPHPRPVALGPPHRATAVRPDTAAAARARHRSRGSARSGRGCTPDVSATARAGFRRGPVPSAQAGEPILPETRPRPCARYGTVTRTESRCTAGDATLTALIHAVPGATP